MNGKKPKILITGLNGLIGWQLFRKAAECNRYEVYGTYAKYLEVFDTPNCFQADLDDPVHTGILLRKVRPDYFIHSRAICDLDLCESIPEMAEKINVLSTRMLMQILKNECSLKKLIYLSTDHVFGGERGGYHERDTPSPIHVYGKTKLEAEEMIGNSGLPYLIIRPGLVIGSSVQGNKGPKDFLVSRIRACKPTHYFTDEWRTPVHAGRLAHKILELLESSEEGIFHIAGREVFNRYELALHLAGGMGITEKYIFPRKRHEDKWAHIRPKDLSLTSIRQPPEPFLAL